MGHDDLVIIGRVTGALVIGALIGFERTLSRSPGRLPYSFPSLHCVRDPDDRDGLSKPVDDICRA
jgi:hypothetical protein